MSEHTDQLTDRVKGMGILLVAYAHAARGIANVGHTIDLDTYRLQARGPVGCA